VVTGDKNLPDVIVKKRCKQLKIRRTAFVSLALVRVAQWYKNWP